MPNLTDWLARNLFTSAEDVATHDQVKAAQAAAVQRQLDQGKVSYADYLDNTRLLNNTGTAGFNNDLGRPGLTGFLFALPWYAWLGIAAAGVGVFLYLGGGRYLKGILKR